MNEILIALITGGCSIVAVILTNRAANEKMLRAMDIKQAVTDERLAELTREVRAHNHFAERMPVVEEQIRVINHRIEDLENYHKPKN